MLCWPGRSVQDWDKLLHHPPGCLPLHVPLSWNKGERCKGLRSLAAGRSVGGHGHGCSLLAQPCCAYSTVFPFICGLLSRNTHEKPLIRRRLDRRGSRLRAVQAALCRERSSLRGRGDTQQGHSTKTKHLNFGFSGSGRSSLLVYQAKKVSLHISGCRQSWRHHTLRI